MNSKKITIFISIIAVFLGATFMYMIMYFFPLEGENVRYINSSNKNVTITDNGIADAVEKVYDSVVFIENYQDDQLVSSGTGFVYKKDNKKGYIITNHHVVNSGNKIYITLTTKEKIEATLLGGDQYYDIAVLTIEAKEILQVASIGKTDMLRLGDTVFAVGAPLDGEYSNTITRGIISGKDRMVKVSLNNTATNDYIMKVLQTDAAINSGNSGGPLCNANGEVIGIAELKLASVGVEGMGFAMPIEDAISHANELENGKEVQRPLLGITMLDINDTYSLYYSGITVDPDIKSGVVVESVLEDTPAYKAKIKKGDIIIKIDDENIDSIASFKYYLYKYEIGDKITLTYYRDKKEYTTKVTLNKINNQ